MTRRHSDIVRRLSRPLEPIRTGAAPELIRLDGIRAVLFDVYGTLLISASGDVGTAQSDGKAEAFTAALAAAGVSTQAAGHDGVHVLHESIEVHLARARGEGVEYPEVDVVAVWHDTFATLRNRGRLSADVAAIDLELVALEYEIRANPVWPMPHSKECIAKLRGRGLSLGIISNAQFYTREVFAGLFGGSTEELGFDPQLQYYSYQHGRAKPGAYLYRLAKEALLKRGIQASGVLYVGNDVLNDVLPAAGVGFRTALFAGDARSLRRRTDDPRVAGVRPDVVLTDLVQLAECI